MSRSYRPAEGLNGLGYRLLAELLPGHVLEGRCPCEPLGFHYSATYDDAIPAGALVAALVRHGWPERRARRTVAYGRYGYMFLHDDKDYRRSTWRAYRRGVKNIMANECYDDIPRFVLSRGWDTW